MVDEMVKFTNSAWDGSYELDWHGRLKGFVNDSDGFPRAVVRVLKTNKYELVPLQDIEHEDSIEFELLAHHRGMTGEEYAAWLKENGLAYDAPQPLDNKTKEEKDLLLKDISGRLPYNDK